MTELSAPTRALSPPRQSDELADALDRVARRIAECTRLLPGVVLVAVVVGICIAVGLLGVAAAGTAFDVLTWTGLLASHGAHVTTPQLVAPGTLLAPLAGGGGTWWRWRRKRRERQRDAAQGIVCLSPPAVPLPPANEQSRNGRTGSSSTGSPPNGARSPARRPPPSRGRRPRNRGR